MFFSVIFKNKNQIVRIKIDSYIVHGLLGLSLSTFAESDIKFFGDFFII